MQENEIYLTNVTFSVLKLWFISVCLVMCRVILKASTLWPFTSLLTLFV